MRELIILGSMIGLFVLDILMKRRRGLKYHEYVESISKDLIIYACDNAKVTSVRFFGNTMWNHQNSFRCILTKDVFYIIGDTKELTTKIFLQNSGWKWNVSEMEELRLKDDHFEIKMKKSGFTQESVFIMHSEKEILMKHISSLVR